MKNSYKDACDICGKFDYLKSRNNKCLCQKCIKSSKITKEINNIDLNKVVQLSIFDVRKEDLSGIN